MKKLYVDEILNTGKVTGEPGPDRYSMQPGFGMPKDNGILFSMRPKNDPMVPHLDRANKLPGPASYHDTVNLAGKAQLNSRLKNQPSNAFEKSGDRFRVTTFNNPSGTDYSPKVNLNENHKSQFKFAGSTKFGQETRTFIDQHWDPKEKTGLPGAGQYQSFSEFDGMTATARKGK